ncbi:MAG: hypothetical protein UW81_C0030G0002 [Candidatus Giovannonibacteria bacterium GW2011_GWC2_44_9]|uniref:Uncharacterized protein n=1 Tax=Candidatus Giovannonibacteria bacterium GW2011_GWC2_44_9 TaxID=1618658 RepID=A0A0G1NFI0_9BACT|nr:MAG: hypothetical protein UW81_C0030G0002 [Candidatus Giovannonibacteria bacterium GW2011_GWC2_44_9]
MIWRFVRFLTLFNVLLILGVIVFLHYGIAQINLADATNISTWLEMVNWSMGFILFLFYLLLASLTVIFFVYLRRSRE